MVNLKMIRKLFRKKAGELPAKMTTSLPDNFDADKFENYLKSNNMHVVKIVYPFYRVTKKGSYLHFDIFPAFNTVKRKYVVEKRQYRDEKELAGYINDCYSSVNVTNKTNKISSSQ